jgi:hypothetical protein
VQYRFDARGPFGALSSCLRIVGVAAALALASAFATSASAAAVLPTLYVDYSTNCTFVIVDDSGKQISQIAPGTYQVQLNEPQPLIANGSANTSGPACNAWRPSSSRGRA